ncbi:MAG: DNA-deoxyinosine glycosylase [Planctomycetota bacterium]
MARVFSFPPIESNHSRVLVLGTMPGIASLRAMQYYAHPQNAFWKIVSNVFEFDSSAPYGERVEYLRSHGVAVWDVLKSCSRPGSLDSNIDKTTIVPNDFAGFFCSHEQIARVCFNGAAAESLFTKYVRPNLLAPPTVKFVRLPSTSPANASISYKKKLAEWRIIG